MPSDALGKTTQGHFRQDPVRSNATETGRMDTTKPNLSNRTRKMVEDEAQKLRVFEVLAHQYDEAGKTRVSTMEACRDLVPPKADVGEIVVYGGHQMQVMRVTPVLQGRWWYYLERLFEDNNVSTASVSEDSIDFMEEDEPCKK